MDTVKKGIVLGLALVLLGPAAAFAATWVTPSGAVVDDYGNLISPPPAKTVPAPVYAPVAPKQVYKPVVRKPVFFFTLPTQFFFTYGR